jgi:hypothetical protein
VNKMMEDEEPELEEFPEAPTPIVEESQDTAMTDSPAPTQGTAPETVESAEDQPKRKRGKRKVLRKTTKRDEKGYLGISPMIRLMKLQRMSGYMNRFQRTKRAMFKWRRSLCRVHRRRLLLRQRERKTEPGRKV